MKHYAESAFMHSYPLSQKKPLVKTIKRFPLIIIIIIPLLWFLAVVMWMGFLANNYFYSFFGYSGLFTYIVAGCGVFGLISLGLCYWYEVWYFKTYFYNATDKLLVIRKGVFMPREITVPFNRIQDVYLDQDIIDRVFNLYDVHISTATAESTARAHIDGVDRRTAEQLREIILQKMQENRR